MAQQKVKIRSLYVCQESSFGVDPSASGSLFTYLHAVDASMPKVSQTIIPGNYQNESMTQSLDEVAEQKSSLTFKLPLRASGTPGTSGAAIAGEADLILQSLFGTVTRGSGTAVSGGNASTTNIVVTSSAGFTKYMMVYCTATSEMRYVSAIPDGTHVTLNAALASAPTTGNLVASCLFTPALTGHKSLAFNVKVGTTEYTLLGGKIDSAKLTGMIATGRPLLELGFSFDSYSATTKASLPAPDDLFPSVRPAILKGCPFFKDAAQTQVAGLDLDFGYKFAFTPATDGVQGRQGMEKVDGAPKGTIEPYFASAFLSDLQNPNARAFAMCVGNQNNGWGFVAPICQLLDHELQAKNEQLAHKLPFAVKDNGNGAAELALSVF